MTAQEATAIAKSFGWDWTRIVIQNDGGVVMDLFRWVGPTRSVLEERTVTAATTFDLRREIVRGG